MAKSLPEKYIEDVKRVLKGNVMLDESILFLEELIKNTQLFWSELQQLNIKRGLKVLKYLKNTAEA